ncbi:lysozyme inhibitor LprI family protein [Aliihoeflea sp. PC F10.4]
MRAIVMTIPALLVLTIATGAEEQEEATCPDAVSTIDIVECLGEIYTEQDARLNTAYRSAIDPLEGERRTLLRDAQRSWVAFRDANCQFYRSGEGTIAAIEGTSCMVETTRSRVDELEKLSQN